MGEESLVVVWDGNRQFAKESYGGGSGELWTDQVQEALKFGSIEQAERMADELGGHVISEVVASRIVWLLTEPPEVDKAKLAVTAVRREEVVKPNEGGPAFPRPTSDTPGQVGMSLRDYFAGQALVGLLAFSPSNSDGSSQMGFKAASEEAYAYADAMLKARKAQQG